MPIMFNEICINEEMLPKYAYIYIYIYIWKKIMDSNPTVCEEKLTSNPNKKGKFIEKQSRHYSVSVQLNHHQVYEGLYW